MLTMSIRRCSVLLVVIATIATLTAVPSEAQPGSDLPFGALDKADYADGALRVAGWALDPNSGEPIDVHFYVDGQLIGGTRAAIARPDVGVRHRLGDRHGFDRVFRAPRSGTVCAWGLNVGPGHNRPVACRSYGTSSTPTNNHRVLGRLDSVRVNGNRLHIGGWAFDGDVSGPISVHVYVGDRVTGVSARSLRRDVARVHGVSPHHGFNASMRAPDGVHRVCAYGIDASGRGPNIGLGCRTVIVGQPSAPVAKRGAVVTPTGVVVPVIETRPNGWLVYTPCFRQTVITRGTFVPGAHIVIDAGHGGSESGAVGSNGLTEKELNLAVARRLEAILEQSGLVVQLTRHSDLRVPLRTRAEIAEALEPALFVSVHHNGGAVRRQSTPGIEAYYQHDSAEARRAGGILYEELRAAFSRYNVAWVGSSRGVTARLRAPGSDLYGIHRFSPNVPSVITEAGYLSNPSEARNLARPDVQQAEAQALADGILRWLATADAGSGYTPHFIDPNSTGTGGTEGCRDPALS